MFKLLLSVNSLDKYITAQFRINMQDFMEKQSQRQRESENFEI